jgi:hypothetical protein
MVKNIIKSEKILEFYEIKNFLYSKYDKSGLKNYKA